MRIPLSQIETFDTTPNKLKFHWRERKNNTRQEIAVDRMYYHTIDLWKECEFFIKDHIGCGFNKTFKEWCKRHNKIENGINTREYFKKQLWDREHMYYEFYLDENNIIRQKQYKRPRKPSLTIVENEYEIVYEVNKKALKTPELKRYFEEHLDGHTFEMLYNNQFLTFKQYRSLLNKPNTVSLNELSRKINSLSAMYFRRGVFYETPHILNYIDKELQPLFKEKILYGVKQIYRGEKEYKKHFAEQEDQDKKTARERKKRIIENKENLLHRIEERRKWEKEKNDIIDRDRLGFDENSFKGEAYHGQKRKKRKNKTTKTIVVENQTDQS